MFSHSIYKRTGESTLSQSTFVRLVSLFTLLEGALVAVGAAVSRDWVMNWGLLIGTFVAAIVGICMFHFSHKPLVSGVGVSVMSISMGLLIGPLVKLYDMTTVLQAVLLTGLIMVIMSILGIMFPNFFTKWGLVLLPALTLLLVGLLSQAVLYAVGVPYEHMAVLDYVLTWAGIAISTGLVAYDWSKAMKMNYTVDNAIDASGGIILDAINLFLYILRAVGGSQAASRS